MSDVKYNGIETLAARIAIPQEPTLNQVECEVILLGQVGSIEDVCDGLIGYQISYQLVHLYRGIGDSAKGESGCGIERACHRLSYTFAVLEPLIRKDGRRRILESGTVS